MKCKQINKSTSSTTGVVMFLAPGVTSHMAAANRNNKLEKSQVFVKFSVISLNNLKIVGRGKQNFLNFRCRFCCPFCYPLGSTAPGGSILRPHLSLIIASLATLVAFRRSQVQFLALIPAFFDLWISSVPAGSHRDSPVSWSRTIYVYFNCYVSHTL
jgi:hypothetical protein